MTRRRQHEIDRELESHIEERAAELAAEGLPAAEARRRALAEFGGTEPAREALFALHRWRLEDFAARLRFALRTLRRAPLFSAAVILTLALGIGANSAVFSALDAVLLAPLPFPHGDRLVQVQEVNFAKHTPPTFVAPARLADWNRLAARAFSGLTGAYTEDDSEISGPLPVRLRQAFVAPHFLAVLEVAPELGRDFTPAETKFGGPNACLISDRLWHARFHGSPAVLGRRLRFGQYASTIVGVLPADFAYPDRNTDVWQTAPFDAPYAQNRGFTWFLVVGRLRPGVSLAAGRAALELAQRQLGHQFPATDAALAPLVTPLKQVLVGSAQSSLWLLYGAVTLLLLIVCANIAGLLLTRAADRQPEIAVRFALGASRSTVVAQLLLEVGLLALAGAALGLWFASLAAAALRHSAADWPRAATIAVNARVAVYTFVSAVVVTFLCGAWPAWRATRRGLAAGLARRTRTQSGGRGRAPWLLVGAQMTMAVLLLAGAGLLLRSWRQLGRVSPGFDPSHVLSFLVTNSWAEGANFGAVEQRVVRTLAALRATPGVTAAATAQMLPGLFGAYPIPMHASGAAASAGKVVADSRVVSPGYFATMRIPVLAGETCQRRTGKQGDAMVNQAFARTYFPGRSPLGETLTTGAFGPGGPTLTVRGVVADARDDGLDLVPMPRVYWCYAANTPGPYFLVRAAGDPAALVPAIRQVVHRISPARSVYDVAPLTASLGAAVAPDHLRTVLLAAFALAAILLACLGLYGTLSYLVAAHRREIGVRLALGAPRREIVGRFLGRGLAVGVVGCGLGLLLALWAGRLIASLLYGVSPFDPATWAAVAVLVLAVAAAAVLVPALRAARTDPARVLREE